MRDAVLARMDEATLVIKAAAVADYRPVNVSDQKLKRTGPLTLELAPTEDILAEVVRRRRPGQLIIGFAAETENRMENGRAKLLRKGADAIVVNDVAGDGVGIDADTNAATFLTRATAVELPRDAQARTGRPHPRRNSRPSAVRAQWSSSSMKSRRKEAHDRQAVQNRVLDESIPVGAGRRQLIVE